jgi:hypothetical protein
MNLVDEANDRKGGFASLDKAPNFMSCLGHFNFQRCCVEVSCGGIVERAREMFEIYRPI